MSLQVERETLIMANSMRKMAVYLGLVEDDRYPQYADYDDYDDPDGAEDGRGGRDDSDRMRPGARVMSMGGDDGRGQDPRGRVTTITDRRPFGAAQGSGAAMNGMASGATDLARITTIHPRTYNDARSIGETFREGTPVIMNVTEMEDSDAKRLVDFAAGLVFGLHGTIERVTNKVFLLSPANVTVTAEDKERMAETGFFNHS